MSDEVDRLDVRVTRELSVLHNLIVEQGKRIEALEARLMLEIDDRRNMGRVLQHRIDTR